MFRTSVHPAYMTIGQGMSDAFAFAKLTYRQWLPVLVVAAAAQFAAAMMVGSLDFSTAYHVDSYTGRVVWTGDFSEFATRYVVFLGITSIVSLIAGWIVTGVVITNLRGRPLTAGYVVERGLYSIAAGFLLGIIIAGGFLVVVVLIVAAPPLGIIALLAAIPVSIYVLIRLVFINLAVFDGFGPIGAIEETWRLSRDSVLRLFGWGIVAALLTGVVGAVGRSSQAPIVMAASLTVTQAASLLLVFFMAMLYESERARKDPNLYPLAAYPPPGAPQPGAVPGWPGTQQGYPTYPPQYPGQYPGQYPPAGYPPAGYPQGGYPPQYPQGGYPPQGAYPPQYPQAPYPPNPYYGATPAWPGSQPADSAPLWKSPDGDAGQPPAPTTPPAPPETPAS